MDVGAYEAKTKLSQLLDRVEAGELIRITRRGRVVAILAPPPRERPSIAELTEAIRDIRESVRATPDELRSWMEEGRR